MPGKALIDLASVGAFAYDQCSMRLPWLVGLALCGCLSTDLSTSDTENESDDDGDTDDESTGGTTGTGTGTSTSSTTTPGTTTTTTPTTTTPTTDTTGVPQSNCMGDAIRVATFNIESVGTPGTAQFDALRDILARIAADVACMQEVGDVELGALGALAEAAGYPNVIAAEQSQPIGGELRNACIARVPIELVGSYNGDDIAQGYANDVGRDILVVRAEPTEGCYVGLFAVHLKSGEEDVDYFRRQVEVVRLLQVVDTYKIVRPNDGIVLLGDFNEQTDAAALGTEFAAPPPGLPDSYEVGEDIEFPLRYHPFDTLSGNGFSRVEATWEGSDETSTWQSTFQLDYVFLDQATPSAAEVYNACQDQGGGIPKEGEPLPCATSSAASDHMPVVADLVVP